MKGTGSYPYLVKAKAKKFREFLKEIKLLEWSTLKLGDKDYHDVPSDILL